tara:strand:+ start:673 stop:855 length:183 start_codon:yes stop_codon:yes gene_type:complete
MRGVISEALEKYGLIEKSLLCVEKENEDGDFEPIESECINVIEDGSPNDWANAKIIDQSR